MITFPSLPNSLFFLCIYSKHITHIVANNKWSTSKKGFDFFLTYKGRGRHRMVIRGHIKNGNGTNKYLTGSRDVRKKGFPIYLNTTYDLLSLKPKRKRKLFIPSLFFLQTIPSTAIYTEKMRSFYPLPPKFYT